MPEGRRVASRPPPRSQDPFSPSLPRSNFPLAAARDSPASSWSRTAWGRPVLAPPLGAGSGGPGDGAATLPPGRPVARGTQLGPASPPALRFVPTGNSSPTTASALKLTPARRGGAAAPRPPPTPGRGRPASCSRRECRPGAPRGRPDLPGLGTQRGLWQHEIRGSAHGSPPARSSE